MLKGILIGHIGNDAEVKTVNGQEFTTFRVAHSEKWTDAQGQAHEQTQWVDCVMNGSPAVLPYLKRGQLVYVEGSIKTRVYSSAKDRCMKAGLTISVRSIELLGGRSDVVPSTIVDANGTFHSVTKCYFCQDMVRDKKQPEYVQVMNQRGNEQFQVDRNGFIYPLESKTDDNKTTDGQQAGAIGNAEVF